MNRNKNKNLLNQDLEIGEITEEKIEAAYDIIRARCREQQTTEKIYAVQRKIRTTWAAVLAIVLIFTSGIGAMAAVAYFSKQAEEIDSGITYTFDINYELKPVEVLVEPGYLPEGIEARGEGRFGSPGSDNFTITPLNMINIDEIGKQMSFMDVDRVEKKMIQNMEAHILTSKDEQKYHRNKHIILFNPQSGYAIWIYGNYSIPLEELEKVAENLEITVNENPSLEYDTLDAEKRRLEEENADEAWELQWKQLLEKGLQPDEITPLGEERYCEVSGCGYTVEEVTVADSLYELPGYTEKGVGDPERLRPWLNEDGTHKPYCRVHYSEKGELLAEEETAVKFMAVKVTAHHYTDYKDAETDTSLNAELVRLTAREDGSYGWALDYYMALPNEEYDLQMDNAAFCLDQPEKSAKDPDFFYRTIEKGESLTYTLIFAVDEDWLLEDQRSNLVLQFGGTGNDPLMPMYNALFKNK